MLDDATGVDPSQRPRLAAIARNLTDRISEARTNGWLGEVQGLQTSLEAAKKKLVALDRLARSTSSGAVAIGMPGLPGSSDRTGPVS